jgi:hypothetical protein
MATALAPHSRLFSWTESIANSWNRSKHRRQHHCPLCSIELHRNVDLLIRQGFYQPAIAATRLRIELIVVDYYRKAVTKTPDGVMRSDVRSVSIILLRMHAAGEISLTLRQRIDRFYKRASQVVHGQVECTRLLAREFANEAETIIAAIRKGGAA